MPNGRPRSGSPASDGRRRTAPISHRAPLRRSAGTTATQCATPIELEHASTTAVFGECFSEYDMRQSQDDGATVPICCESRLADIAPDDRERPSIDADFEDLTEAGEAAGRESLKAKRSGLENPAGADRRLDPVAGDLVEHFGQRLAERPGKAMAVCMSRRIRAAPYDRIVRLRPARASEDDAQGEIGVVMTGNASDPPEWRNDSRNQARREALARRFRDPDDPLRLVPVRDMWLTGFGTRRAAWRPDAALVAGLPPARCAQGE